MRPSFTSATCPECQTYFDRLPVAGDGRDVYAALEVKPCRECGAMLCSCCAQFACDACGNTVCLSHLAIVDDLRCCSECTAAFLAQDAQELLEPAACIVMHCDDRRLDAARPMSSAGGTRPA